LKRLIQLEVGLTKNEIEQAKEKDGTDDFFELADLLCLHPSRSCSTASAHNSFNSYVNSKDPKLFH